MPAVSNTVRTQHGLVTGWRDSHPLCLTSSARITDDGGRQPVAKWLAIPYARAERFQRPTSPETWSTPKDCFEFGSQFPQPPSNTELLLARLPGFLLRTHIPTSEDSHFINVFAPGDVQEGEELPVLVWIYGGALNNGDAGRFFYDPTELVRDGAARGQRCIVVTLNYRTNVFGFCASKDLQDEDPRGLCGNYGLYDVVAALEWVQANIAAFGGSPARVTAFGQSAGAFIVSHLLVGGKKLFQRAICQSGAVNTMMLRPVEKAYPAYEPMLVSLGVDLATSTPASRLAALRAAPADALLQLHTASHNLSGLSLTLEPKGEGIWTEDTMERLRRGERDEWVKEVIMGVTEDEGTIFAQMMGLLTPAAFAAYLSQFPTALQPRLKTLYLPPSGEHPEPGTCALTEAPASRLLADQVFVHPVWDQACALASAAKVFLYRLRTGPSSLRTHPVASQLGIFHSIDLPLVFNGASLWTGAAAAGREGEAEADKASAEAVGSRWLAFAISGEPDPAWPAFDPAAPAQLVFGHGGATSVESLADFAEGKLELRFAGEEDEGAGEEVLGKADE
ncbi:hypothetical protein JCM3770_006665 [Rhodotorula araucariae]